jgi:hypothetical protein
MLRPDIDECSIAGPHGSLAVPACDAASVKLAMLIAGECLGLGPTAAAEAFGYTKQRYFQLKHAFAAGGVTALADRKPGPAPGRRDAGEAARQVIRHRFLDPEATPEVIAQKLSQVGQPVSARGVQRVIAHFGLQKKTP